MSLKELNQEQIDEISMIDLATMILEEEGEAIDFNEIFHRIASLKGFSEKQKEEYISQFYTDMNIDGSFMTIGTNRWGLKRWYPVEQMEEEIAALPQKRKKKKKKKKKPSKLLEDELGVSEFDDEDLEEDLDLTDEDLDLDDDDDDYDGDYEDDDLDEEEEEIVEDDISFIGDDDEEDE
ncbi:DNA-directed RNA polymerase subunit delta [Halobacillus yeomjeoni]|uniref:Probable DNA-directed RNA polymerase subunit delta n=1 Tax=Halobacillus yeomjeoni TaxID=311194 RepID=A0A931MVN7_9BACI|nr:DNA-directed RNA polymerase subunit delta [Halobacillus yeomjeoni]MBH0230564.1 DNA-directed RNA polymerase subunit delta [Halobacillus yeomjeoni]MCA0985449.1 DNA-directed RNA polymerase subunit delta [Halobacillus yeomjeoni]